MFFKMIERDFGFPASLAKFAILVLFLCGVLTQAVLIVDEGEEYAQVLFGEVAAQSVGKGFHFVNPLASFHRLSLRQEEHVIEGLQLPAQDKLKSTVDLSIVYQFQDGVAPYIYTEHGSEKSFIRKQLLKKAEEIVRETGKTVELSEDFFTETVQTQMKVYIKDSLVSFFNPLGMNIVDVRILDIDLPPVVRKQILATKERTELVNQQAQQLEIVTLEAEEIVRKATANASASISNATAIKELADAEAYKIEVEASAQAAANTKLANSATPGLADYIRSKRWDGAYPKYMLSEGTNLLMSLPKE